MTMEKTRKRRNAGTTLVELVVAMLLFSMISLIVIGVLSPAAKIFVRMQRLQFAQIILDNTIDELRTIVQEATEYVKIYENGKEVTDIISTGTAGDNGKDQGLALEFLNQQGYVVLVSTQGCGETTIVRGGKLTDQEIEVQEAGRLLTRYYAREKGTNRLYLYTDSDETLISRAVSSVFTEGYYMGNYLKITFSYPTDAGGNVIHLDTDADVAYLVADVELYGDQELTELIVQDSVILDFKYPVKCKNSPTAKKAQSPLEHY